MKKERVIIFETRVGSHLYGTNRPESDEDFLGVFLPATKDMLGLQHCPSEWSENVKKSTTDRNTQGDIDRKFYSLQRYLGLLAEGQSAQLEMLFAGHMDAQRWSREWQKIRHNKELFVSKQSIMPFIGFAKAQAHKATVRGENLNLIRDMILYLSSKHGHMPLGEALENGTIVALRYDHTFGQTKLKYVTTEGGLMSLELAGRQYEFTQQVRYVLQKLKRIEEQYGSRSEAASKNTYDYKSLLHAYRLLFEAKMLLTEGELRFPLPKEVVDLLKSIRNGEYQADYFTEIEGLLTELREIKTASPLQESPNIGKIDLLCQEMLYEHLFYRG